MPALSSRVMVASCGIRRAPLPRRVKRPRCTGATVRRRSCRRTTSFSSSTGWCCRTAARRPSAGSCPRRGSSRPRRPPSPALPASLARARRPAETHERRQHHRAMLVRLQVPAELVGDLPDERDLVLEPSRCCHDVLAPGPGLIRDDVPVSSPATIKAQGFSARRSQSLPVSSSRALRAATSWEPELGTSTIVRLVNIIRAPSIHAATHPLEVRVGDGGVVWSVRAQVRGHHRPHRRFG
jgi:hypothetical protein